MLEYSTSMASKFFEGRCFLLQVFVYCHHFTYRGALLVEAPQGLLFPPLLAFLPHQSGNKDCNSCRQGKARLVSWSRHLLSYHTVLVRHNVSSQAPPPLETSSITVFLLEGLLPLAIVFFAVMFLPIQAFFLIKCLFLLLAFLSSSNGCGVLGGLLRSLPGMQGGKGNIELRAWGSDLIGPSRNILGSPGTTHDGF